MYGDRFSCYHKTNKSSHISVRMGFNIGIVFLFCVHFKISLEYEYIGDCSLYRQSSQSSAYAIEFICVENIRPNYYFDSTVNSKCTNSGKFTKNHVKTISFRNCRIPHFAYDIWNNYKEITELNMTSIELESLPKDFFNGAWKLETMILSYNHLIEISKEQFFYANIIKEADYSFNYISKIDGGAFIGASALKCLNLSHNLLNILHGHVFSYMPNLDTLNISFNAIENLEIATFSKLTALLHLDLSHNNLSNIQLGTLSNQRNLLSLDLSHNFFKSIDFGMFLPRFDHLGSIFIESNDLSNLDGFSRIVFPKLHSMSINGNNFNCSYLRKFFSASHWSREWIISFKIIDNMDPKNYEKTNINGVPCNILSDATEEYAENESIYYTIKNLLTIICASMLISILVKVILFIWTKVTVHKLNRSTKYNCNCNVDQRISDDTGNQYDSLSFVNRISPSITTKRF